MPKVKPQDGYQKFNKGDFAGALEFFLQINATSKGYYKIACNIAECYAQLEQYEKTIQYSDKSLKLSPNYSGALLNKACGHYNLKQFPEALDVYNALISHAELFKSVEYFVDQCCQEVWELADQFFNQDKYDEAIQLYVKINKVSTLYNDAACKIGEGHSILKNLPEAVKYYSMVDKNSPRYEEAQDKIGELLERCSDFVRNREYPEAIKIYSMVDKNSPHYAEAQDKIGECHAAVFKWAQSFFEHNIYPEAIKIYSMVDKNSPHYAVAQDKIGECHAAVFKWAQSFFEHNIYPEAIKIYSMVDKNSPHYAVAQDKIGECHAAVLYQALVHKKKGVYHEALSFYIIADENFPDNPEVCEAITACRSEIIKTLGEVADTST